MSGLTPDTVLAAHQKGNQQTSVPQASVLMLGAGGRLGEALLATLSAHSGIASISVTTVKPIEMGIARLRGLPLAQLQPADYAIVHLVDLSHPLAQSGNGRDAAFAAIDEPGLVAMISQLESLGVKHLVVVKPLSAFQQIGGLARQLMGEAELQLHQAKFQSLTLIRPVPLVEPSARPAGSGFLKRFFSGYMRLNFFTLPKTFEPIRTDRLAALIVDLALQAQPGLKVFAADQLRVKLESMDQSVTN